MCCNPTVLKKSWWNLLKIVFFLSNLHKKGVIMDHAHNGKFFLGRNKNSRSSPFRNFLFYQNIICFDWVFFYLEWCFLLKKSHFQPKQLLKLVSAIFYQILIFHHMIVLQKLWKMFFISSKKLFSFLRYSNFCIFVFPSFSVSHCFRGWSKKNL